MKVAVAIVALAGCGRLGFQSGTSDAPAGVADTGAHDGLVDMPADAGLASCAGFDLCDHFEGGTLAAVWTKDASVTLDGTRAHTGTQSVRVKIPSLAAATSASSQISETAAIGGPATTTWVRAWLYMSAIPAGNNRMEMISVDSTNNVDGIYAFVHSMETAVYSEYSAAVASNPPAPPTNQWFCVVFQFTRATDNTGLLVLGGDVATTTLTTQTDGTVNPPTTVRLGIGYAATNVNNPQPATDVWIDDVIVHHAAVTCSD